MINNHINIGKNCQTSIHQIKVVSVLIDTSFMNCIIITYDITQVLEK